jgi:hypothetical protein
MESLPVYGAQPAKAKRGVGRPPMNALPFERQWVQRLQWMLRHNLRPVDVYVCRDGLVHLRVALKAFATKRVPPTAKLVGRYTAPVNIPDFLDDVAATMAQVRA